MFTQECREHATDVPTAPVLQSRRLQEAAVKTWLTIVVLFLVTGCATAPSGAARTPSASDIGPFAGNWAGTIMSHDMASALGLVEAPARLTLVEDGRFTLTSSGGSVATGVARRTNRGLVLDGQVIAGDPMTVGRNVSFVLTPRGNALYGDGETFYLGHRIDSGILLGRPPA